MRRCNTYNACPLVDSGRTVHHRRRMRFCEPSWGQVNLDQERARADRLARERTEEEEALSGELRDIMATVTVGSDVSGTPAATAAPAGPAAVNDLPFDSESIERQQPANKTAVDKEPGQEPPEDGGGGGGGSAIASASGIFSEWRLGRVRGGRASDDDRNGNNAGTGSGKPGPASETRATEEQEKQKDSADGPGGDGQKGSSNGGGGAREQAAGALRVRVVELELQRAEAADEMREKTDRSIRLEVQVRVVTQSLNTRTVTVRRQARRSLPRPLSGSLQSV